MKDLEGALDAGVVYFNVISDNDDESLTLSGVPVSANINEGEALSFTATATGTNLTFSLDGAPPAASIDPDTGEFSWTPTEADGPDTTRF